MRFISNTARSLGHLFSRVEVLSLSLSVVDGVLDAVHVVGGCFLPHEHQTTEDKRG